MKKLAKKLIIFSMVGLMQVGMFASVAAAAPPRPNDPSGFEQRDEHHHRDLEREKQRRIREENERHEKEMKRRPFESKQHWHERQKREIQRHERAIHEIMEMGRR
ncbi:hypothetical protein [Sporomusa acidovorans]|uniref:Uncharacterized protein n=1 Tax=Sporomusa acidovorans (strain ATCC 49682 / DSM 3132 / Mol) TaxID=1123286 RepID=A0ABZ3JBH6_SPOA4|nr:hypothetical protein [Sporomusa acidovorans]OZC13209.1 hypothetical protein SPACI_57030 [Sporomusa acidovorans DSM 3132]SDE01041.1 hypothetical protein SAMN04488499_1006147 [Sporomusa acidovorans]